MLPVGMITLLLGVLIVIWGLSHAMRANRRLSNRWPCNGRNGARIAAWLGTKWFRRGNCSKKENANG
jgi:hypothetical protein